MQGCPKQSPEAYRADGCLAILDNLYIAPTQDMMTAMARPVELVTTLEGEDARRFLEELEHPKRNRAWERTLARARRIKID